MADVRQVKVSVKDIESVSEKLQDFAKNLPQGEQNVMAWLLARAADAPPDKDSFVNDINTQSGDEPESFAVNAATAKVTPTSTVASQQLARSLGVQQFGRLTPGSAAAGSSVGVTGSIMI